MLEVFNPDGFNSLSWIRP